ncbi:head GIN domain-containing protein [Sphingomonas sp. ASV193]|uniref:head GIN domain-containing protein n=1 Tax=Sphingomonas sp. ASV193 TaxID=3144405 RepID=UPI0032E88F0F
MNRIVALVAATSSIALGACHWSSKAMEPGPDTSRNYALTGFSKIAVAGPFDVRVHPAGAAGVVAHGGQNVLDNSEIEIKGDTLLIKLKDNLGFHWKDRPTVTVDVGGAPALAEASIAGSGKLALDQSTASAFKGNVAGSGDLSIARLTTTSSDFSIAGSGSIRAAGTSGEVKANIAGSGDIDTSALQAQSADASIAGSGNIKAHASGTAKAAIMGSGDIVVTGGATCDKSKMGSGTITCG